MGKTFKKEINQIIKIFWERHNKDFSDIKYFEKLKNITYAVKYFNKHNNSKYNKVYLVMNFIRYDVTITQIIATDVILNIMQFKLNW